ncbi:MAG: hypothetical protein HKN47_01445 [Pirellulaceae bacterium]|nr:hypothetical protein [Pirellulaceae bacterium]
MHTVADNLRIDSLVVTERQLQYSRVRLHEWMQKIVSVLRCDQIMSEERKATIATVRYQ